MKVLGIDYGEKRVGIALSDESGSVGFPHGVFENTENLVTEITALAQNEKVGCIVIGESKDLSGTPNPIQEKAEIFARELAEKAGVPVHFEPEYFTTVEAARTRGRGKDIDASAAAIILQSYLDKEKQNHE